MSEEQWYCEKYDDCTLGSLVWGMVVVLYFLYDRIALILSSVLSSFILICLSIWLPVITRNRFNGWVMPDSLLKLDLMGIPIFDEPTTSLMLFMDRNNNQAIF